VIGVRDAVFWLSLAGSFALTMLSGSSIKRKLFYVVLLIACGVGYLSFFQSNSQIQPKGGAQPQWAVVVVLYVFMVMGMLSHYLYDRFTDPPSTRQEIDIGNFLAPILISPIVFAPLWGAFQSANADFVDITPAKLMVFLVAFENGFFWRQTFETRRRRRQQK